MNTRFTLLGGEWMHGPKTSSVDVHLLKLSNYVTQVQADYLIISFYLNLLVTVQDVHLCLNLLKYDALFDFKASMQC